MKGNESLSSPACGRGQGPIALIGKGEGELSTGHPLIYPCRWRDTGPFFSRRREKTKRNHVSNVATVLSAPSSALPSSSSKAASRNRLSHCAPSSRGSSKRHRREHTIEFRLAALIRVAIALDQAAAADDFDGEIVISQRQPFGLGQPLREMRCLDFMP